MPSEHDLDITTGQTALSSVHRQFLVSLWSGRGAPHPPLWYNPGVLGPAPQDTPQAFHGPQRGELWHAWAAGRHR